MVFARHAFLILIFTLLLNGLLRDSICDSAKASTREGDNSFRTLDDSQFLAVPTKEAFAVNERLKKNVDFWVRIYTYYGINQGLIHDAKYVDIIYEIVNLDNPSSRSGERDVKKMKKKWKDILLTLHHKQNHPESMNEEEKRVYQMFIDIKEPNKFLNAANRKRLRFQQGMKENFIAGLKMSGEYLPLMEDVFRKEGLPVELTRLPFVESSFNVKARSKVGASGIWQFMRSTGRLFLKINDSVDERNDPVRATEAAAKLLKGNYESLRTWPLAVTAYNHGRKGMMRAVRKVGSEELEDVVDDYRSRTFGFASSNFFTELLACIDVEKNADKYFGKVDRENPLRFYEVQLGDFIDLGELVTFLRIDADQLKTLNPALTESVFEGRRLVPAGYRLRLPLDKGLSPESAARVFMAGYEQIPGMYKFSHQRTGNARIRQNSRRYGKR
jgi:membrane-bound lytic murein transglycosylase D